MFEKRMVFFAGEESLEKEVKSPADLAKEKMAAMMSSEFGEKNVDLQGNSVDDETKKTNDSARADIIAIVKEGKKFNPAISIPGIDDWKGLVKDLKAGANEHFATVWQSVDTGEKKYYFMMVRDKTKNPSETFFIKQGQDFSIKETTLLGSVSDEKFKELTGKEKAQVKKEEEKKKAA